MERITKEDQEDNIFSPRTSDISAAFDLTAKVLYCLYCYCTIYSVAMYSVNSVNSVHCIKI